MSNTGDGENAKTNDTVSTHESRDASNASQPASVEPKPINSEGCKKRKLKSWVWEHFEKNKDASQSICKYCSKALAYSNISGTSSMINHLNRCKKYLYNVDKGQSVLGFATVPKFDDDTNVNVLANWKFDQTECRKWLAKMTIIDELPFIFVEHDGFRGFCRVLQPRFIVLSRRTIGRDCYLIYMDEMTRLKNSFKKISSRICLTTDSWTSIQNLSYMCLTAHFIDDDWRLHKRIISFCPISELDKYLLENREISTPSFEILNWWKVNASRYPTLALIARDVLAIPVSTVASESAFSTGGRLLDSFRSALTPRIVEALVCSQNWLRSSSQPIHLDNILEQLEAISLEESCITEDHPLCTLDE